MKSFFSGVFVGILLYMVLDMHASAGALEVTSIATASAQLLQEAPDWGEEGDSNDDGNHALPPPPGPTSSFLGGVRAVVMPEDSDDSPDAEYEYNLLHAATTTPPPAMNRPGGTPPAQFLSQP